MRLRSCAAVFILIVLAFAIFHVHNTSAANTALGNLAASMQPGTWAQLTTNNINPTLSDGGVSGIIFGFTEYIKWDPVGHRLYYLGGDHVSSGTPVMRHVQYDEATNSWSILPEQSWFTAFASHGYDHGAIDPAHRYFYFRPPGNLNMYRWNMDTRVWTQMPANNVIQYDSCCVGIEYFPELHGVLWASDENGDNGGVTRLNDATGQWDRIGQSAGYPMGEYHNFAEYNPVKKVVVFGGGEGGTATRQIYKLDAAGTITPLAAAPVALGIQNSIFTVDPLSGDYLVFTSTNQFYVYNVVTDTWTLRASGSSVPIWTTVYGDPVHGVVGGPIDTYGVNVFVTCDGTSNCKVSLYKHSAGSSPASSDTTPPAVSITSPAGGSTLSGTTTVSANASDNVGVASVQFKLDGNNLGAQLTTAPYSISWNTTTAGNGSHTLTAVARDAAGNQTTSAPVAVPVSNSVVTSFDFSLSTTGNATVVEGQSTSYNVTATLLSGTAQPVSLSVTGLPSGATGLLSTGSCVPNCSSSLTVSASSSTPTGAYPITVTGASGSVSHTTSFTLTVSAPSTTSSTAPSTAFAQKCAQSGVVNCFNFDSSSSLNYTWPTGTVCDATFAGQTNYGFGSDRSGPGNTAAVVQNGQCVYPKIDTTNAHSGAGSLKFTIPSNSDANSSGFFTEPFKRNSNGTFPYIGPGSPLGNVLYFQFYQMFDTNFVNTNYQCTDGECTGWKQAIWYGNPPNGSSSSNLESTMNNGWQRNVPQMYGQSGTDDYGIEDSINCTYANATSQGGSGSGYNSRPNYQAPLDRTCFHYPVGQWTEFTGRIEIRGTADAAASRVQLWINGQPAIDYGAARIDWSGPDGNGFGQFLLTPYHTRKNPTQAHPVGYTWYDDVIISTQPIAMMNGTTSSPSISITAPAAGSTVSGSSVTVSASASSSNGIAGVQFQLDGSNLGAQVTTSPFSVAWNTTTAASGTHMLTAIATDAAGNQAASAGVAVTVKNTSLDTTPPAVSLTSPANGSTVSGTTNVSATASDNVGVLGVQFQLDGANLGAEDTTSPYSVSWNTTTASNGSHTLTAIARDAAGNRTTSSPVTVTVTNSSGDTTPPTVSLTSPANGSTISGAINVSVTASDNAGVVGVQFLLDGSALGAQVQTAPYSVSWNTTTVSNGSHTLTAVARDAAGNTATSAPVGVTVSNVNSANSGSTVAFVQGAAGTSTNDNSSGTIARSFATTTAAGDLIVAAISWGNNSSVRCSDSQGNTYAVATTQYDSANNQSLAICYAANIKGGADTITATFSASAPYGRLLIHEYSGIALIAPVDVVAKHIGNGSTTANAITSGAATTTASGDLVFGAVMDDSGVNNITAGTGFTQRQSVNNKDLASEDLVQPLSGSIAAKSTFSTAHRYLAQMVTFKHR